MNERKYLLKTVQHKSWSTFRYYSEPVVKKYRAREKNYWFCQNVHAAVLSDRPQTRVGKVKTRVRDIKLKMGSKLI